MNAQVCTNIGYTHYDTKLPHRRRMFGDPRPQEP